MPLVRRSVIVAASLLVAAACSTDGPGRAVSPTAPRLAITTGSVTCPTPIEVGQRAYCSAIFYDQNNDSVPAPRPTWSSSDTTVLRVDTLGAITGIAHGSATVTAADSGVQATTTVTVNLGPTIGISGPATVRRSTSCTWTRTVSGGTAPYSYSWSDTGGNPTGTGTSYTATIVTAADDITLTVTDANGGTSSTTKHVTATTTAPLC